VIKHGGQEHRFHSEEQVLQWAKVIVLDAKTPVSIPGASEPVAAETLPFLAEVFDTTPSPDEEPTIDALAPTVITAQWEEEGPDETQLLSKNKVAIAPTPKPYPLTAPPETLTGAHTGPEPKRAGGSSKLPIIVVAIVLAGGALAFVGLILTGALGLFMTQPSSPTKTVVQDVAQADEELKVEEVLNEEKVAKTEGTVSEAVGAIEAEVLLGAADPAPTTPETRAAAPPTLLVAAAEPSDLCGPDSWACAKALYEEGATALAAGEYAKAEVAFKKCVATSAEHTGCWWEMGWVHWMNEDWKGVAKSWSQVEQLEPNNPKLLRFLSKADKQIDRAQANSKNTEGLDAVREWVKEQQKRVGP